VPENESAAIWLVKALEQELSVSFPLIVAGKNPGSKLMQLEKNEIIKLVANPSDSELKELQVNAHIHVFYSEAPSGMKLKLMNVLATNGHILCNENMLGYDGLEAFCIIENESENFARRFVELKEKPLSSAEYENRKSFMSTHFNTKSQCEIIIKLINEA
jgi:hypothetical protein